VVCFTFQATKSSLAASSGGYADYCTHSSHIVREANVPKCRCIRPASKEFLQGNIEFGAGSERQTRCKKSTRHANRVQSGLNVRACSEDSKMHSSTLNSFYFYWNNNNNGILKGAVMCFSEVHLNPEENALDYIPMDRPRRSCG